LRAETHKPSARIFLGEPRTRAPFRLLPIRAPRQAVLRTSSWLAPSRFHQQVLRPPGGEDARCVRPMSATQTNYVHPHLVRSRLALATFAAGTPHEVLGSVRYDRGTERFTTFERPLRRIVIQHWTSRRLPHGLVTRAWALSSHGADAIEPLTLLSRPPVQPHASPGFPGAATWPHVLLLVGSYGSEAVETAKTTVHACS